MSLHVNRLHKAPLTLVKLLYPSALKHRTPLFEAIFVIPYLAGPPCWTMSFVKLRLLASELQPNCAVCLWAFDRILNNFILIQGALDGLLHWLEIQIICTLQHSRISLGPPDCWLLCACLATVETYQEVFTDCIMLKYLTYPWRQVTRRGIFPCLFGEESAQCWVVKPKLPKEHFVKESWEFCPFRVVLNTACAFACIWYSGHTW